MKILARVRQLIGISNEQNAVCNITSEQKHACLREYAQWFDLSTRWSDFRILLGLFQLLLAKRRSAGIALSQ